MIQAKQTGTQVRTGEVRSSYASVFEPRAVQDGQESKYQMTLIIPKTDIGTVNAVFGALEAAKEAGKQTKFGGKIPPNLATTLYDGDAPGHEDMPEVAGCYYLRTSSKIKPGLIKVAPPGSPTKFVPITDTQEFGSGDYCVASINFYPYSSNGNKGVSVGLNNILMTRPGERFGGGASADSEFDDLAEAAAGMYGETVMNGYQEPQAPTQQYQQPQYNQAPQYQAPAQQQQQYAPPAQPQYQAPVQQQQPQYNQAPQYQAPAQPQYQAPVQQQAPQQDPFQQPYPQDPNNWM